jgi:hypothetical protein
LHVPSIAVSISLIDLSNWASADFWASPQAAAAARVARDAPRTSPLALQKRY